MATINQFVGNLLKNVDLSKGIDNISEWIKKVGPTVAEKLNVSKDWLINNAGEIADEFQKQFMQLRQEFQEGLKELNDQLKQMFKQINTPFEKAQNLKKYSIEFVNEEKLRGIVRENMVAEANQVAVYMKELDKMIILYICYLKDDVIIENDKNTHIIITAEGISRDLSNYFSKSKLIVLR